jgi:hypothetical protein
MDDEKRSDLQYTWFCIYLDVVLYSFRKNKRGIFPYGILNVKFQCIFMNILYSSEYSVVPKMFPTIRSFNLTFLCAA